MSRPVVTIIVFALVYAIGILTGYVFFFEQEDVAVFWPATGVILGTLLSVDPRKWPMFVIAASVTQAGIEFLAFHEEILRILSHVLMNAIEPVLIASLIYWRSIRFPRGSITELGFTLTAILGGTAFTAIIGGYLFTLYEPEALFLRSFQVWWLSDSLGLLIVTPLVVTLLDKSQRFTNLSVAPKVEFALWTAMALLVIGICFLRSPEQGAATSLLAVPWLIFPVLGWSLVRLPLLASVAFILLVSIVSVSATGLWLGPFVEVSGLRDVHSLQAFLMVLAVSGLMMISLLHTATAAKERILAFFEHSPDALTINNLVDGTEADAGNDPDEERLIERMEARVAQEGIAVRFETNDVEGRTYRQLRFPISNHKGEVEAVGGIATDISQSIALKQQLQDADLRYKALISQSPDAVFRIELKEPLWVGLPIEQQLKHIAEHAFIAECNDVLAQRYEFSNSTEMVGQPLSVLTRHMKSAALGDYLRHAIESGYRAHLYPTESERAGSQPRLHLNSWVGLVEDGYISHAWGLQIDVTEKRELESAMALRDRMLRHSLESAADGGYEYDLDTGEAWFSNSVMETFGYTDETVSRTYDFMVGGFHPEDRPGFDQSVADHIHALTPMFLVEARYRHAEGHYIWIEVRGCIVERDENGMAARLLGIVTDITETKRQEELLVDYRKRLELASAASALADERARRDLAGALHDGPLQDLALARILLVDLVKTHGELNEINQLLESAITQSRSLMFQLSPPILYELGLTEALDWLTANQFIDVEQSAHFSTSGEALDLQTDVAVTIYQIARELLINVKKHAKATSVDVNLAWSDNDLLLTVADDGIGFGPDAGQGYGLFTVRNRIDLLAGKMSIESSAGSTSVSIRLPLAGSAMHPADS